MNVPKSIEDLQDMGHEELGELHRYCLDQQSKVLNESNEANLAEQMPKIQMLQKWVASIGQIRIEKINADAAFKRSQMTGA